MSVKKLEEFVNWNWLGLAAGLLSVVVTFYNIKQYTAALRKGERGGLL